MIFLAELAFKSDRLLVPNAKPGAVIYSGDLTPTIKETRFVNFTDTADIITKQVLTSKN